MTITAAQVKELRETTGLGMMICKKALTETDGDMQKAVENLRKQGQATAQKRAAKAANEGKVSIVVQDDCGLIYEVNSETDFVARNDDFVSFVNQLGTELTAARPADMTAATAITSAAWEGRSVEEKLTELIGKIGEKITFRRFSILTIDPAKQLLASYIHGNGKIGVIVALSVEKSDAAGNDACATLGKELAMQIAAASPIDVDRERISKDVVEKEKEIYLTQAQTSGRPEKVWDKIVEGKLNKFFKETVLLEQEYIRDSDLTVAKRIQQTENEVGCKIAVDSFVRYALGSEQ
jgi:elongation factor Ts